MKAKRKKPMTVVEAGRLGGLAGGWRIWRSRLTPEEYAAHQRRAAAKASLARWGATAEIREKRNAAILIAARGSETYSKIGKRFGVDGAYIHRLARAHGIDRRAANAELRRKRDAAILEAVWQKEPYPAIAERFNVNVALVNNIARKAGIRSIRKPRKTKEI